MKSLLLVMGRIRSKAGLSIFVVTLIILGFQNCSQVKFEPAPEAQIALSSLSESSGYVNGKPTARFVINDGAPFTNKVGVNAQISSAVATEMILKNGTCPLETETAGWLKYEALTNHTLESADGNKAVFARVRDSKKVVSECLEANIFLDKQAPTIETLQSIGKIVSKNDALFIFQGNDAGSGIDKYFCRITGQTAYSICQPRVEMKGLSDGSKTINVYVTDRAGNNSEPVDISWIIDTVAPTVQIVAPVLPNLVTQTTASIHFLGADAGSGIEGYRCSLNGVEIANCSSPQILNNLAQGNHSFSVVAIDKAGLASLPAIQNFQVDSVGSSSFQILGVTGGADTKVDSALTANVNPTLHWSPSTGAQSYTIQVFNQARTQMLCQFTNVNASLTSQSLGACGGWAGNTRYSVSMVALRNGIQTNAPNFQFTIDFTGPTITIVSVNKEDDLKRARVDFTITDFSGVSSASCLKIFSGDVKTDNCLGKTSLQYENLLEGKHDFRITAVDSLGNATTSNTVSFQMDYVVCDPFRMIEGKCQKGLKARLFYASAAERTKTPEELRELYPNVTQMITKGLKSNAVLYLPSIDVRTREFRDGFSTTQGQLLKDDSGAVLDEWFGLEMETLIKLGSADQQGYYQLIAVSDDGSRVYSGTQLLINNDGLHSTKVGCMGANQALLLNAETRIPLKIQYFQGPRTQIAMSLFWRKVSSPTADRSQYCDNQGEDNWGFGRPQHYQKLMIDGFKPLLPENFILNEEIKF